MTSVSINPDYYITQSNTTRGLWVDTVSVYIIPHILSQLFHQWIGVFFGAFLVPIIFIMIFNEHSSSTRYIFASSSLQATLLLSLKSVNRREINHFQISRKKCRQCHQSWHQYAIALTSRIHVYTGISVHNSSCVVHSLDFINANIMSQCCSRFKLLNEISLKCHYLTVSSKFQYTIGITIYYCSGFFEHNHKLLKDC